MDNVLTAVICIPIAFFVGAIFAHIFPDTWPEASTNLSSSDWAAWVQAIGSICAIIAAVLISWAQSRLARESLTRSQLIADKARQSGILAIAEAALEHARRIDEAVSRTESGDAVALSQVYDQTIIDGIVQALTAVPAQEVGSRDGVMALLSLRDQFRFLGVQVEKFLRPWMDADINKELESLAGADDRDVRREFLRGSKVAFAKNVRLHLTAIRTAYAAMEGAINRPQ
jgi:hypothetical protein